MRAAASHRLSTIGLLLVGCAHAPTERDIKFNPMVVIANAHKSPVEEKSEPQLFDDGTVLFRAGDLEGAAEHFDQLFSKFPGSLQANLARYNSGLAHERLGHFPEALERYKLVLEHDSQSDLALDAKFHAALAEYKLDKKALAAERLRALAELPGLAPPRKAEALMQEAICIFELGKPVEAEALLNGAMQIFESGMKGEAVDPSMASLGEFWLGEIYRSHFRAAAVDPAAMDEARLSDAMETKARLLITAQGHYLRAIKRGQGEWATAAGFRIGELYETFHDALLRAPLPKGLDADQAQAYRAAVRERVRVLISKAIQIYEETLATAQRVGAQNDYVEKTRQALDRLKKLLLDTEPI